MESEKGGSGLPGDIQDQLKDALGCKQENCGISLGGEDVNEHH